MGDLRGTTFADVIRARPHVYRYVDPTPLHAYPALSELVGADIHVKHENHHQVGAFKVRGGVNLAASLSPAERKAGLVTASTGNHGQSIAFAGKVTGTPVRIAMPERANPLKAAAIRRLGAEVVTHGRDFDEAREWMQAQARTTGARFIGPTEPELIAGVGTYTLEIMERLPDVEVIIVPVGAGSGAASASLVAKSINPGVEVIAVQAERAPAIQRSWQARKPVAATMETDAEGLATRVAFQNTLNMICDPRTGLDDFILVSDEAMAEGVRLLLEHTRNVAEMAGAASLAAAIQLRDRLAGRRVVLVLSGGNITLDKLQRILTRQSPPAR
jgi:threonine dehydratase